jgi:hypothetical protein
MKDTKSIETALKNGNFQVSPAFVLPPWCSSLPASSLAWKTSAMWGASPVKQQQLPAKQELR